MTLPRSFYFIRHGQTAWNVEARLQGHANIPLNHTGLEQVTAAAERLRGVPLDVAVSSDLSRALVTAEKALAYHEVPLLVHAGLRERYFGDWEGQLSREMKSQAGLDPSLPMKDYTPPQGESWEAFNNRVFATVTDLLTAHDGEMLLVAHGYVFVALTERLLGLDKMCTNAVPYHFYKQHNGVWRAEEIGA